MQSVLLGLAGLFIGSLVNGLADDLPQRRPPGLPACRNCGQVYPPRYWIAALAYLFGGRCARCGTPVRGRLRHVLVEAASAGALAYLGSRFGWSYYFFYSAVIFEILLLVTVIDVEHRWILPGIMLPAMALALLGSALDPNKGLVRSLIGGAIGFGVTYLFYLFGRVFARAAERMRGEALTEVAFGRGDVYLGAFIGLAVGWAGIIFALVIGVFAGGAAGALYLLLLRLRRRGTAFQAIPYGPWLALGCLVMLVWAREFARYLAR